MTASRQNGTLYIGVTSNLLARASHHWNGTVEGFTKQYGVSRLVWYEFHSSMAEAIQREKRLKKWRRSWKIALIEAENPGWDDLFPRIV